MLITQAPVGYQDGTASIPPIAFDKTFKLHSNPFANHTIYLDFDGYFIASSQWENGGALQLQPYYSGSTFTDANKEEIQKIWQRVAEDFAPFNVNVTTEEPNTEDLKKSGNGDQRWGIRVAMTSNLNLVTGKAITNAGGGGTAYYNSFNWATDEVALVFNQGEYAGAETVSHEVGHTLNLRHDGGSYGSNSSYYEGHGSGATSWGTIMGAPFINADENVTQWSKGEYIGANNTEDDLAIITSNGFSYRVDDYGNTLASAFELTGSNISTFGIIERTSDIDWFKFVTGVGNINFNINNASRAYVANGDGSYTTEYLTPRGPNLDIFAKLFDASGNLLVQNNPSDLLTASLNYTITTAGTYYLSIDGVGVGNPFANPPSGYTEYASLGQYLITGSVVQPTTSPAILVSPTSGLTTTEAGTQASFTVVLATQPSANVTIGVSSSNTNEGIVNVNALTFTSSNWNVPQTVTITGADDSVDDDNVSYTIVLAPASSTDPDYGGLDAANVTITNQDNDTAGILISSPSANNTTEDGGTVTFAVHLKSKPTADVTLPISSSDISEGVLSASSLVFTSVNWNISQIVTVTGVNDGQTDGNVSYSIVTGTASSIDGKYNGLNPDDVVLVNNDNEPDPVTIFSDSFEVSEWNGLWIEDSQNDWFRSTQRARDGSRSAEVDGTANNATLTIAQPLNLTAYSSATLSFSWFIESNWDSGEYIALDFWNGSSWQEQQRLAGNISPENVWQDVSINVPILSNFQFRFRASVSSSNEDGNVDNVKITALPSGQNTFPQAFITGNTSVNEGAILVLSGANSTDSDGSITRYDWDFDGDGQYDDATGPSVNFTTSNSGIATVGLQVTDNLGGTAKASQIITVNNVAPIANAGISQTGFINVPFVLSGANSTDPGNDIMTYAWDLDADGHYDDGTGVDTTFIPTQPGIYTIGLQVTDADGASSTDTTTITVQDKPAENLLFYDSFELSEWNGNWVEDNQNDWFRSTQRARDGSHSAEVDGLANNATLTMARPLNLADYSSAVLTFSWFIEGNWDYGEYIALDLFNGSNWTEVKRLSGNVDPENSWQDVSLALPLSNSFNLRFRATVSSSLEDGNIDNVRIVGLGSGTAASAYGLNLETPETGLFSPMGSYGQVLGIGVDGLHPS
ncbi:hypothetical protein H6G45_11670 [Synechocystis sp. FACHB-383]|uniref:PKD domain-containing protein n=1 Tax=Synechocystis sp. FACHB-383 TaxID=2692864 RepID=UPI0016825812|nr:PKD domain-containing protein [Synechocystis sp. FACHB-383]MBD2654128.1 hypothetical protein [Synechocystis sp. FACHB-383]